MTKASQPNLDLLAVGETLVDLISEEEVDTLAAASCFRRYQGGSPANIAANVARLGGRAGVVSKIGAGAFGNFLRAELRSAGVCTDYLQMDPGVRTSLVFVARSRGTPDFEAFRDADYRLKPAEIPPEAVFRARVVHASAFALSREPCRSAIRRAFRLAQEQGKIISLDPNYSPAIWPDLAEARRVLAGLLAVTTITKPSLDDAARLWGSGKSPQDYANLFHDLGPRLVVLTMGADGVLISEDGERTHIPQRPVEVADTTGAGDSFWAGFIMAMLDDQPLRRCGLFAREVVERKLKTVGPLPGKLDRRLLYAALGDKEG